MLGSFACGSTVQVVGWQEGWYNVWWRRDQDEGSPEGWVEESQLLLVPTGEPLFTYTSIAPVSSKVRSLDNGPCVLPYNKPGNKLPENARLYYSQMQGQWVGAMVEDADYGFGYLYFYPSDLTYTRRDNGDGYRYGIVISDDPRDRLNLRAEPDTGSERLGKYFSGTVFVGIRGKQRNGVEENSFSPTPFSCFHYARGAYFFPCFVRKMLPKKNCPHRIPGAGRNSLLRGTGAA